MYSRLATKIMSGVYMSTDNWIQCKNKTLIRTFILCLHLPLKMEINAI